MTRRSTQPGAGGKVIARAQLGTGRGTALATSGSTPHGPTDKAAVCPRVTGREGGLGLGGSSQTT